MLWHSSPVSAPEFLLTARSVLLVPRPITLASATGACLTSSDTSTFIAPADGIVTPPIDLAGRVVCQPMPDRAARVELHCAAEIGPSAEQRCVVVFEETAVDKASTTTARR